MKKILFVMTLVLLLIGGCSFEIDKERARRNSFSTFVEAEVLIIETKIIEGFISSALSFSSGSIKNDTIKVGVSFSINDEKFLKDLRLFHSELAYYKDKKSIPLKVTFRKNSCTLLFHLGRRIVGEEQLSYETAKK